MGQLNRLQAALRHPRKRAVDPGRRLVGQAGELEKRTPDLARQRDAVFEVPIRVLKPARPQLGAAQADQSEGAQVLTQAARAGRQVILRRVRDLAIASGRRASSTAIRRSARWRASSNRATPNSMRLGAPAPVTTPFRACQARVPLRHLHRSAHQLIRRGHRRELGIGRAGLGGEGGEQLMEAAACPPRYRPGQ